MRYLLIISLLLFITRVQAQTNTFPSTGNTGIGTTSPEMNLHITSGNSGDATLRIEADEDNNNENDNPYIDFFQDGGTTRAEIGYLNNNFFGLASQGPLSGSARPAIRFGIDLNGKVGIGTTTPISTLDVNGQITVSSSTGLLFYSSNTGVQTFQLTNDDLIGVNSLRFNDDGMAEGIDWMGGRNISIYTVGQGGFNAFRFGTTASFPYVFQGGNVGIGNTSPTEKLVVDGKILAEEVKVQTVPASDYVFEPDYDLKPLHEVDQFIQQNKHLPDIPSAQEFAENGVGLGEMDDMLLRKVEELTLYMIALQKKYEDLQEKYDTIVNQMKNK